ncbi:hypothetical protein SeLEV6574_g04891 [Synchytrium endobioticum]|nr:hypothetical protein SeLEV6574_g04891 [Synchytrium endobioticum]
MYKDKKRKTWNDGIVTLDDGGLRAVLYDDRMNKLDTLFLKPNDSLDEGDQVNFDTHIVEMGSPCTAQDLERAYQQQVAAKPTAPQQQHAVLRSRLTRSVTTSRPVLLRPAPIQPSQPSPSLPSSRPPTRHPEVAKPELLPPAPSSPRPSKSRRRSDPSQPDKRDTQPANHGYQPPKKRKTAADYMVGFAPAEPHAVTRAQPPLVTAHAGLSTLESDDDGMHDLDALLERQIDGKDVAGLDDLDALLALDF